MARIVEPTASSGPEGGPEQIAESIWRWERRHPEWHPGAFGARVGSYLIRAQGFTLLVDPLVTGASDPVLDFLDHGLAGLVRILVSIPYHARSAELLCARYRENRPQLLGHGLVAKRLGDLAGFRAVSAGETVDGVARFHPIGRPVRAEMPIEIPSLRALVFGDAVVEFEGQLRLWESPLTSERRARWYAEKLLPTLVALARLDPESILVTHGRPILEEGRAALEEALRRGPWQPPREERRETGAEPETQSGDCHQRDSPRAS